MLSNETQHAPPISLPPIIPLSLFSLLSIPPSAMCVSARAQQGDWNPCLNASCTGISCRHTHTYTHRRTSEDYKSLKSSSLARHQILHPSVLSPFPLSCPRTRLTGTGLHFNFLLILNFEWYKLFSAIKAPKFKAIIGILNPLGSLFSN